MGDSNFFSITAGEIVELISVMGGMLAVVFHLGSRARAIEAAATETKEDISELRSELKKYGDILVTLARQNERLDMLDRRLDDIVRGRIRIVHTRDRSEGS